VAFGDVRTGGVFDTGVASITNPLTVSGSCTVSVGDLIIAVLAQQTALTVTAVSDNLGNTYTAQNAGTDAGNITGRMFYSRVTNAGTLTSVSFTTTASTNDAAAGAVMFEGPFLTSPLDANPANSTADITSPFSFPATGTLAQTDELVVAWAAAVGTVTSGWTATSPLRKHDSPSVANAGAFIGSYVVAATTTTTPEATGTNPTQDVLGTATFKKDTTAPVGQPTMRRLGGVPGTTPDNPKIGRSWFQGLTLPVRRRLLLLGAPRLECA
jgi:hypothetical protein